MEPPWYILRYRKKIVELSRLPCVGEMIDFRDNDAEKALISSNG